jgi:DNA polymerase-4
VRALLRTALPRIRSDGVTLVGVAVANLADEEPFQPELPFLEQGRLGGRSLDRSVDAVRDRFGSTALTRAALLGHDSGMSVPLLPD